jgi:hypothetical protein
MDEVHSNLQRVKVCEMVRDHDGVFRGVGGAVEADLRHVFFGIDVSLRDLDHHNEVRRVAS